MEVLVWSWVGVVSEVGLCSEGGLFICGLPAGFGVVPKKEALRFFARHFTPFGVRCFLSFRSSCVMFGWFTVTVWGVSSNSFLISSLREITVLFRVSARGKSSDRITRACGCFLCS